jgi:hypothetical protein
MTETAEIDKMLTRIKNRKVGTDKVLEERSAARISVSAAIVTQISTFKKTQTTDAGNEEVIAKYFTEKDAYLVTVTKWDAVADKETCLRTQIVPLLADRLKLHPKVPVVFQFLDRNGQPMRHMPAPGPKVMARGD